MKAFIIRAARQKGSPATRIGQGHDAEDAARAGKGCDRTRAAIKGSVKEMTFEKTFEKQRR